jgi:hypothetical protein
MTERDRDRLVVLKKAQKKLITQSQAAKELDVSERHVRRLLVRLREAGDKSVIHGLRGRESNRKLSTEVRDKAVRPCPVGGTVPITGDSTNGDSVRRWPASIWRKGTSWRSAGRPCDS